MKTRRATVLLLLAFVFSAHASPLRDQLDQAKKADDTYAQIELIRRILDQEPADADLHENLADLWLSVKDYDMAEKTVTDWKDAPEFVRASVIANVLYNRDQKTDEAIKVLADYHAKAPDDLEITRQLADYLAKQNKDQEVIDLLAAAPGVPDDADLLVTRAISRRKLQDFNGALADFALADKAQSDADLVSSNRTAFERLEAALPGINAATAILQKDPNNLPALLQRAYWYYYTGFGSDLAREDANAARRLAPDSTAAIIIYAQAANSSGKLLVADAMKKYSVNVSQSMPSEENLAKLFACDLRIQANPKDVKVILARSYLLNEALQFSLAKKDAEAALVLDPNNLDARIEKIFSLVKMQNYDAATAEYNLLKSAKIPPEKFARASSYLVDAAFAASKFDLALDYANRAIQARPNVAQYYKQRAAILQRISRSADAEADLAKATALEKSSKP